MTTATSTLTGTYAIDPSHSSLEFAVKHAMVSTVRGRFADFEGTLALDQEQPERSTAEVSVRLASVDTGNADRDGHLRGSDFFGIEETPSMTFRSTAATAAGEGRYRLTGDLTLRGQTKPVTFDIEHTGSAIDPWGNERIGFEGTATIKRSDWGLTWNAPLEAAAGVLVSDKVKITLDVSATKQA